MNRSATYRRLLPEIRPLAGTLGAEISGLDLSQDVSPDLIVALREALLDTWSSSFPARTSPRSSSCASAGDSGRSPRSTSCRRCPGFRK